MPCTVLMGKDRTSNTVVKSPQSPCTVFKYGLQTIKVTEFIFKNLICLCNLSVHI